MIEFNFIEHFAPILVLLVSFILIYAALKLMKVPGTDWVLAILSFILSLIFVSSTSVVSYVFNLLPLLTVVLVVSFFILLILAFFVTKDFDPFRKPLAWVGFIIALILVFGMLFSAFPTFNHLLPSHSNSGLSSEMVDFKDFIYSDTVKDSFVFVVAVAIVFTFLLYKAKK